jgi:hypothetical protein
MASRAFPPEAERALRADAFVALVFALVAMISFRVDRICEPQSRASKSVPKAELKLAIKNSIHWSLTHS